MRGLRLLPFMALLGLAVSQAVTMPECALKCSAKLIPESGCDPTNMECICSQQVLKAKTAQCLLETCTPRDALTSLKLSSMACKLPVRSKSENVLAVAATFGSIAMAAVLLRLVARPPWSDNFGWDDGTGFVAGLGCIPLLVLAVILCKNLGVGQDLWMLTFNQIDRTLQIWLGYMILYSFMIGCTKVSMLCFYLRVFPQRNFKKIVYGLLAFTTIFSLLYVFLNIFQCQPVSAFWTGWDGERTGYCLNGNHLAWSHAGINIALDFTIIALPIPQLLKIYSTPQRKLQIVTMFAIGFLISIVSIIRLHSITKYATTANFTWDYVDVDIWSLIELNVSVFVISMPSLVQFSRQYVPKVLSSSFGSKFSSKFSKNSSGHSGLNKGSKGSDRFHHDHVPHKKKLGIAEGHLNSNFDTMFTTVGSDNGNASYRDAGIYKSTQMNQTSSGKDSLNDEKSNEAINMV